MFKAVQQRVGTALRSVDNAFEKPGVQAASVIAVLFATLAGVVFTLYSVANITHPDDTKDTYTEH